MEAADFAAAEEVSREVAAVFRAGVLEEGAASRAEVMAEAATREVG